MEAGSSNDSELRTKAYSSAIKRITEQAYFAPLHTYVTTYGYSKTLEVVGTGYRVQAKGNGLELALGFSHPVSVEAPAGINFQVETPTRFQISGIDKQLVGEVAANIRKLRKPEPYKGKGVRYAGEVVRRKAGKAGK